MPCDRVRIDRDATRVPPEFMRRSDEHVCGGHAGGEDGQEPEVPAAEGSEAERRREPRPHRILLRMG